jgi:hypothetical protein
MNTINGAYFSTIYYYKKFQEPTLHSTIVVPISEVCMNAVWIFMAELKCMK